jgi:hypothetical protein
MDQENDEPSTHLRIAAQGRTFASRHWNTLSVFWLACLSRLRGAVPVCNAIVGIDVADPPGQV